MPRVQVPIAPPVNNSPAPVHIEEPTVTAPLQPAQPQASEDKPLTPRRRLTSRQLTIIGISLGFLILVILLFSLMSDRNKLKSQVDKLSTNSASAKTDEVNKLTVEIGKVFQLPTGETPTLATVSDASKVKNQAFFKDAQNGDKVLLYSKDGEAILYRPSTKKIIAVAPVNLNGIDATSTTNSSTSK